MSARLLLHALLCSGRQGDCELLDKAHEAVEREVLRGAAEKIRAAVPPTAITPGGPYTSGQIFAADLIDPDKEESADGA